MIHTFSYKHKNLCYYFLWDIESGSLHKVDYVAFLCCKYKYNLLMNSQERVDFIEISDTDKEEIFAELEELENIGALNHKPELDVFYKRVGDLKALCLHICHDCNLSCDYCFAGGGNYHTANDYMSLEVGKKAIDFLIANSGIKRNLEVDFFGGEPLLNMQVVKDIVAYARVREKEANKKFLFTMTTNCLMLNKENIDYLNEEMDNVVLSIDGRKAVHNAVRHAKNGKDVYDYILQNALDFKAVRGDKRYYVRGTFTGKNLDFAEDIFALNDLGFDQISVEPVVLPEDHKLAIPEDALERICEEYDKLAEGYMERRKGEKWFNFFHFMLDLEHGPCVNKRLTGCGAGTEYLAVSPLGDLYPCHQFVGEKDYYVGNVFEGIKHQEVREKFSKLTVLCKEHCADCPAKYYCGGGCAANALHFTGRLDGQYKMGCELTRKRLECSLAINAIERED